MSFLGGSMYIYRIKINNFRNIRNLDWKPNKEINVLVGGNGVGKSNIGIAINYLLNPYIQWYKRELSEFDYYNRELNNSIEIELWFKDVENFVEDDWELYLETINNKDEITTEEDCELTLRLKLYGGNDQIPHHVILANGKEYPLRTAQKGFINYIYISANREPLKELSFSNNSLLNSILEKDVIDIKIKELMNNFNEKSRELFANKEEGLFSNLSKNVMEFGIVHEESAISIEPTELSDRKTLQTFSLVCKNNDLTSFIPLKYQSDGIKNLILLLALEEKIKNSGILFVEEVEQNLEPSIQRKVINKMVVNSNKQLFITTHSTDILKMFRLNDIFYLNKDGIKKLPEIDSGIDRYYRKAAQHQVLASLFSKAVLLVEGDAESGGVPVISIASDDFLNDKCISLIRCQGKENIIRFAIFFNYLGIKNIAIYDNDNDISATLIDYNNANLNTLVLVNTKDYETSIVKLPIFIENWKNIFINKIEFDTNKYINNLFIENKTSYELRQILLLKEKKIKSIESIEDIDSVLDEVELRYYLHDFLHKHMASISNAEYLMEYLYILGKEEGKNSVPEDYIKIFKLISVYIESNRCNGNCVINSNGESVCSECAKCREGLKGCYQIKEG